MSMAQDKTEAFSLFGLEPSPDLDADLLKNKFLELSGATHPDRFQGAAKSEAEQKSQALNRAYQILKEPKARLAYLYEQTSGHPPKDIQRIPPGTMDLFVEVGQTCQAVDAYLKEKQKAEGALAKARFAAQGIEQQEKLGQLQAKLEEFSKGLASGLQELQASWKKGDRDLAALETLYRKFSYLARWKQQVDERAVALLVES